MNSIKFLLSSFLFLCSNNSLKCETPSSKLNSSKKKNLKQKADKILTNSQKLVLIKNKAISLIKNRMVILKNNNKNLKKRAIIDTNPEDFYKKSRSFARIEKMLRDLVDEMSDKQKQLASIRDDASMSNSDKELKAQEIYLAYQSLINRRQELVDSLQSTLSNVANMFLKALVESDTGAAGFYEESRQSSPYVRYNEEYLKEQFDDYTDEYKKLLEDELENIK